MFEGAHIDNEWQDVYLCETDSQISSLQLQAEEVTGTVGMPPSFKTCILLSPLPLLIELCVLSFVLSKLKMLRRCITAYLKSCKETLILRWCLFLVGNPCECFRCCASAILVPRSKISLAPSCCLPKQKKNTERGKKMDWEQQHPRYPLGVMYFIAGQCWSLCLLSVRVICESDTKGERSFANQKSKCYQQITRLGVISFWILIGDKWGQYLDCGDKNFGQWRAGGTKFPKILS